jgi:glyoxylase-like metal-dependent hydrolase (beta-lactamase superfamily II)
MIGDISVDRVAEIEGPLFPPGGVFPAFDPAILQKHWADLVPDHYDAGLGLVIGAVQTYVLRTPDHTILVDTGCGNHKQRPGDPPFHNLNTPFLQRLADLGVAPEDVDLVFCTHLHVDHVGWNTTLENGGWVPTFRKATYVFTQTDLDFAKQNSAPDKPGVPPQYYQDSIVPVIASGQARVLAAESELASGLDIVFTPGHSPGHATLRAQSKGQTALFVGDVVQHPLQVYRPDWNSNYCAQPDAAVATRHRVLGECAERDCLMFAAHFAGPYGVHIRRDADSFALA